MKLVWTVFFFFVAYACKEEKTNDSIPAIRLDPDQAGVMKTTDYFDGYEVVALRDVLCESMFDVVEYPDFWLALHAKGTYQHFLYVYDKQGHPLYPIGGLGRGPGEYRGAGKEIQLGKDSTIRVYDFGYKHLEFSPEGDLVEEKFLQGQVDIRYGNPVYYLNDSTLVCHNGRFYFLPGPGQKEKEKMANRAKGNYLLNIVPLSPSREVLSYWKGEELYKYILHDHMYLFRDTCHFYIEKAGEIFQVLPSGIVPRYRIDRGGYEGFVLKEEFLGQVPLKKIEIKSINETGKYVLGTYLFDGRYYIFIYDKTSGQTRNYKTVDDDLLKVGTKKSKYFPSFYFSQWLGEIHFNETGLIFLYRPQKFVEMVEFIRGKMQPEEWEQYGKEHSDLLRIYNELDDLTSVVILKYRYK